MRGRRPLHNFALAALILIGLGLTAGREVAAGLFNPQNFVLDNGMQVVVIEDHRAPVVVHMVWYKVGAADEPPGKSGIAHFLEHLMFKGTKTMPPGEFSKIIARLGGRDNAFTSYDYTAYFQEVASDKLARVMALEADRMTNLTLSDADVLPERDVVLEERRSRIDNEPSSLMSEQMRAVQYLAHPYGTPLIGWNHEIPKLGTRDALDFYAKHYAPNNAVLVVAGDVTADQVRTLAETHYGPIPAADTPARVRPAEPQPIAARRVEMRDERVKQPIFRRSFLAPSRTAGVREHAMALNVLSDLFGSGTTSRLYRKLVVEQKLAASAGAYYDDVSLDLTQFYLYATPRVGVDIAKIETAMEEAVAELLRDGVTEKEVERSKSSMLAGAIYARDSLSSAARIFGTALTSGVSIEEIESYPDEVRSVTKAQVDAAARLVFDKRRSVTGLLLPKPAS